MPSSRDTFSLSYQNRLSVKLWPLHTTFRSQKSLLRQVHSDQYTLGRCLNFHELHRISRRVLRKSDIDARKPSIMLLLSDEHRRNADDARVVRLITIVSRSSRLYFRLGNFDGCIRV